MLREIPKAARALGLQIQVVNAGTIPEIEAAFATISTTGPMPCSYIVGVRLLLAMMRA
jgi:hypothetical protein